MEELKRIKPKREGTRVTFLARLSYVHLDAPWSGQAGNEPRYSLTAIVPKSDTETVAAIRAAINEALDAGTQKLWEGVRPNPEGRNFKYPLKDGDADLTSPDAAYAGGMFLSAGSKTEVPVFNRLMERIATGEAYSGCHAVVSVNFFPFRKGASGVAAGLNAVLKYADGPRLGGPGGDPASCFAGMGIEPDEGELLAGL